MKNKGFSLVELIVVIAIMAILVGVAVPVYSSYIEKAQKAADQQLVDEIKHAMEIAYVADQFTGSATVVLTTNGASVSGDSSATNDWIADVINNAFGDASSLKLKYSGWTSNAYTVSTLYQSSSFQGKQENLLSDVQQLTEALETFMEGKRADFIGGDFLDFAEKYGVDVEDPTQVSNSAALYVAEKTKGVDIDEFVAAWTTENEGYSGALSPNNFNSMTLGLMSNMAAHYARAESLAAYIDRNSTTYTNANFTDAEGNPCSASEWLSAQKISGNDTQAVMDDMNRITGAFLNCMAGDAETILANYCQSEQAQQDAKAYVGIMGAIEENSDSIVSKLGQQDTLYTDGTVNQLLNDYMAAGTALAEAPAGSVAVVLSANQNGYVITVVGMKD